ncbi:SpoIVB peptidase S55 domain-containing protein [Chondromyces crocatus]|uniref:SpoIVB peptidase S55 domain-containing protein n=1 Tax=Chondromyces crocatus TaxID=52 RepID=UPI001FE08085|nr:SpoIVB peptidase S55 domain-containing protein [Chondromyces crocatus]
MVPLSLLAGAVCSVAVGVGLAEAVTDPSDVMPLSEVKPGMKGYGLTVFSGTTPEKFDVEVISTLRNFRPRQDLVLIKTPNHPRLTAARTVAGMSGSPIYLNGKMIGAYAYGWLFGVEAIAGVTPIRSMLDELARPVPKALIPGAGAPLPVARRVEAAPAEGRSEQMAQRFQGPAEAYDLNRHAKAVAARVAPALTPPESTGLSRASTPIMLGGFGGTSLKMAHDLLGPLGLDPLQAGGGSSMKPEADAPTKYVDGGAIGVEMVRGDVSAMGIGTVTRVSGDRLLAFGHPMLNGGLTNLPTAVAKVHWILASHNRSFKIGEAARSLGTLVNDRQAAIVVDTSRKAPVFPVALKIDGMPGAPHPVWNMEVAHDQFLAPAFVSMALGNALEATAAERVDLTWRAVSRVKIGRYGTISLVDFGAGNGSPLSSDDFSRSRLVRAMGSLLNNPWEQVVVERVDTQVKVSFGREVAQLRGAKVLSPELEVGEKARIRLDLQPYQGALESRVIEVPIPPELAGRDVEVEIQPGYDVERPLATPSNVAELVAMLPNQYFDAESMVATVKLRENGAAFQGKVASRLPPGAMDTLRPTSDSSAPETFGAMAYTTIPMQRFVVGKDTVTVKVRPVLR